MDGFPRCYGYLKSHLSHSRTDELQMRWVEEEEEDIKMDDSAAEEKAAEETAEERESS